MVQKGQFWWIFFLNLNPFFKEVVSCTESCISLCISVEPVRKLAKSKQGDWSAQIADLLWQEEPETQALMFKYT